MHVVVIEAFGKRAVYASAFAAAAGGRVEVVATGGHFFAYPDSLWPLGCRLARDAASGQVFLDEHARSPNDEVVQRLAKAISGLPADGRVFIATDADPEGEAIALDVALTLADLGFPIERCVRFRPPSLSAAAFAAALETLVPMTWPDAVRFAAPARARGFLDRWIASTFSSAGRPVGRVLTAALALLVEHTPLATSGRLTLRTRSTDGRGDFYAMLEAPAIVRSTDPICRLARLFPNGVVPGRASRVVSLSAGVAPLISYRKPFTSSALTVAMTRRGMSPGSVARAAQSLYMAGMISYPRTSGTTIPGPGLVGLMRLARSIGVDFDPNSPGLRTRSARAVYFDDPGGCHAALHPIVGDRDTGYPMAAMADIIADPFQPSTLLRDPEQRLVYAEVARRALSAGQPSLFERGWMQEPPAGVDRNVVELLADLDWTRDLTPRPPWEMDFDLTPGLRVWPPAARTAEALDNARLSRPATLAAHAERMARSAAQMWLKQSPFPFLGATPEAQAQYEDAPDVLRQGGFAREVDALAARMFHHPAFLRLPQTGSQEGGGAAAAALAVALAQVRDEVLVLYRADGGDPEPLAAGLRLMEVAAPAPALRATDAVWTDVSGDELQTGASDADRRLLDEISGVLDADDPAFEDFDPGFR